MNEIKHIHLGRQPFTISVAAYRELREYVQAIEQQVGDKSGDVVEEVELRMAELLLERGIASDKVVLPKDVAFLRKQLGEPHDFKDEVEGENAAAQSRFDAQNGGETAPIRRLFRDTNQGMIAGVAAGLAAYFGIDAVVVRLLFVLLTLFGGTGILLYVVLWLIVPEAQTSSERLQMQGKAVTVASLKEVIDRADIPGAAERASKAGRQLGRGLGRRAARLTERLAKSLLGLVGCALLVAAGALFMGGTVFGSYMLMRGMRIAGQVVFPVGSEAVAGLACALVVLFAAAFMLMIVGLAMIRRRAVVRGWVVGAAAGLFLVAAGLGTTFGLDIVPAIRDKYHALQHSQVTATQPFTSVNLTGQDVNFNVVPDTKYAVELDYIGSTSSIKSVSEYVKNNTLYLDTSNYRNEDILCSGLCLNGGQWLTATIHVPALQAANVAGQVQFDISGSVLARDNFTLTTTRKAQAFINNVAASKLITTVGRADGAQQVMLQGVTAASQNQPVAIAEGVLSITDANEVDVDTNDTACDADMQYMYLVQQPSVLTVNGKQVTPPTASELARLSNSTSANAYNCIGVGYQN